MRDQTRRFDQSTVLVGRVSAPEGYTAPIVVAALDADDRVAHQVRLHEAGGYELIVTDGRYQLQAFGDDDGDGLPSPGEPAALLAAPVEVRGDGLVMLLDLALTHDATLPAAPNRPLAPRHDTQAGALADLAAPAFGEQSAREGYWSPLHTFERIGGNIYFLEPYDPDRIPVLFVHGAAGSARDWHAFAAALDRRRYQAWFFQYPSGAALDSMSHLLYWKLINLQLRHRYTRLHVVAHSMGGLVVRRFLLDHGAQFPQIGAFVTLSTPWLGAASATLGVDHSPAVIPSWRDMQPEGDFLRRLFAQPLPHGLAHTLLFSHRGDRGLFGPNSDGSVTLASQLRPEAQAQAGAVMGFDTDHAGILTAPQAIERVQQALEAAAPGADNEGGRLLADLRFDGAEQGAGASMPMLVLNALDAEGIERGPALLLTWSEHDRERPLGPLTPGRYAVRAAAQGYRARPARTEIEISAERAPHIAFHLSPQGMLTGRIGPARDARSPPAGGYEAPANDLPIERIELRGPSLQRVLEPRRDGTPGLTQAYFEGRDDAFGATFQFMDLPAGDYEILVQASGYRPHRSKHRVTPGRVTPMPTLRLLPR